MTPEQRERYIATGGTFCPYCGAADLSGWAVEVDAGYASQPVSCDACGKHWTDVYRLVGIDLDGPG